MLTNYSFNVKGSKVFINASLYLSGLNLIASPVTQVSILKLIAQIIIAFTQELNLYEVETFPPTLAAKQSLATRTYSRTSGLPACVIRTFFSGNPGELMVTLTSPAFFKTT